jgi:two-component system sensor kinase FixL
VVAPRVVFVLADKVQIQQVLLNLMRNAIEAMEDSDRRELVVSTALTADDMVEISVADTGAGISPEIPAHVRSSWPATKMPSCAPKDGKGKPARLRRALHS